MDSGADKYTYLSYEGIMQKMEELASLYPGCVNVYDALTRWPQMASFTTEQLRCGASTCKFMVAEVGNPTASEQVFLSGEVHGDERVGPQAVLETIRLLCDGSLGPAPDDRFIVALPLANPVGYYENVRTENGRDPNRDFPYDQDPTQCLQTVTSRVIHRLFYHYGGILSGITFHGGVASITYPWGSFAHTGDLAPDDASLHALAAEFQRVGGKGTYEIGNMNEVVYPVHGGMEDWSYALGLENTVQCSPSTFGGYDSSYTSGVSLPSASLFLVEVSKEKSPPESQLGSRSEVWITDDSVYISPVPRSVRIALSAVASVKPTAVMAPMHIASAFPIVVAGCIEATVTASLRCPDTPESVSSTSFSCGQAVVFPVLPSPFRDGCDVSFDINFDKGLIGTDPNGKLTYTRERVASLNGSPAEGRCALVDSSTHICVSETRIFVHPMILRLDANITITDTSGSVVTVSKVTDVVSSLPSKINLAGELQLTVSSPSGFSFTGPLTSSVDPPVSPKPVSKLLLLILLLIPAGIMIAYYIKLRRRPKVSPLSQPEKQSHSPLTIDNSV